MKFKNINIKRFFTVDLWQHNHERVTSFRALCVKLVKVMVLAVQGFLTDNCPLRASALTFYSIFSIVPVAALIFGIAKGFGIEAMLKRELTEKFAEHQMLLDKVMGFAETTLRSARGGMIASIGIIVLFWTVIKVISNIEYSFNDIWGIKAHRSFFRKFSDYTSLILICPLLVVFSSSATVFVSTQVSRFTESTFLINTLSGPFNIVFANLLPYFLSWLLFTFIYMVMPNTKVKLGSALIAGIIAGTAYQLLQKNYIILQVALSKYNTIYGSLSALPLFLIWLQVSWLIVLFGAEISFAHQNIDTYEYEPHALNISEALRKKLLLQVTSLIVKAFVNEQPAITDIELAHACGIPIRQTRDILYRLSEAGIINKVANDRKDCFGYQPAVPEEKISVASVLRQVENCGKGSFPFPPKEDFSNVADSLNALYTEMEKSEYNKLLKDL
ncbi:YhjD/YihY/BrkB family envelope integrity protein [Lentisphaerota bacterium ZTH]|nr:YihY family inner membrane protein [Lentisphaerota bacterium]WET05289.1 YhjD/YihY/BrkB family envelope integrity protein [Lentisphaerota bacterium ZTH]